jgi:hypothetical protein
MKHSVVFNVAIIVAGGVLYACLRFGLEASVLAIGGDNAPLWLVYCTTVLNVVPLLLPGVLVGLLVARAPALSGFFSMLLGSLAVSVMAGASSAYFRESEVAERVGYAIASALVTGLVGMCAGAFGHYLKAQARSNKSLERTREG